MKKRKEIIEINDNISKLFEIENRVSRIRRIRIKKKIKKTVSRILFL